MTPIFDKKLVVAEKGYVMDGQDYTFTITLFDRDDDNDCEYEVTKEFYDAVEEDDYVIISIKRSAKI